STRSSVSRTRRASAGAAPAVEMATINGERSTTAGTCKREHAASSTTLAKMRRSPAAAATAAFNAWSSVAAITSHMPSSHPGANSPRCQWIVSAAAWAASSSSSRGAPTVTRAPASQSAAALRRATLPPPTTSTGSPCISAKSGYSFIVGLRFAAMRSCLALGVRVGDQALQLGDARAAIAARAQHGGHTRRRVETFLADRRANRVAAHAEARAHHRTGVAIRVRRLAGKQAGAVGVLQLRLAEQAGQPSTRRQVGARGEEHAGFEPRITQQRGAIDPGIGIFVFQPLRVGTSRIQPGSGPGAAILRLLTLRDLVTPELLAANQRPVAQARHRQQAARECEAVPAHRKRLHTHRRVL